MKKLGFIGCGNMGEAILSGILNAGIINADDIYVYTQTETTRSRLKDTYHIHVCDNNNELYELCDYIILAIKPYQFEDVIETLPKMDMGKVIVSIAAGMTIEKIKGLFQQKQLKVIRVMPNTPVFVNKGASGICASPEVSEDEKHFVMKLFSAVGVVEEISEDMFHTIIATSGSSPAYVFMFIDAIIKEAMNQGLTYEVAKKLAAQTVVGAATMVMESDETPDQLKKNVCSPNGTTIEAVNVLEQEGLYEIVAKAMDACAKKSRSMSE